LHAKTQTHAFSTQDPHHRRYSSFETKILIQLIYRSTKQLGN
jgi:hypothetical protein